MGGAYIRLVSGTIHAKLVNSFPQVTQLKRKRVRNTAVLCHAILANSLARFTSLPTLQRLTDQWTDHDEAI